MLHRASSRLLAAGAGVWGSTERRGWGRGWRGVPRGLVRLRSAPAARGPRQLSGRAALLPGGERPGPAFGPATARAHQGAPSILRGVWVPPDSGMRPDEPG